MPELPARELLIKLDVYGHEDTVIKQGRNAFKRAEGCTLEIWLDQLYENQTRFKDIFFDLDSLEFRYARNPDQGFWP